MDAWPELDSMIFLNSEPDPEQVQHVPEQILSSRHQPHGRISRQIGQSSSAEVMSAVQIGNPTIETEQMARGLAVQYGVCWRMVFSDVRAEIDDSLVHGCCFELANLAPGNRRGMPR